MSYQRIEPEEVQAELVMYPDGKGKGRKRIKTSVNLSSMMFLTSALQRQIALLEQDKLRYAMREQTAREAYNAAVRERGLEGGRYDIAPPYEASEDQAFLSSVTTELYELLGDIRRALPDCAEITTTEFDNRFAQPAADAEALTPQDPTNPVHDPIDDRIAPVTRYTRAVFATAADQVNAFSEDLDVFIEGTWRVLGAYVDTTVYKSRDEALHNPDWNS